MILDDVESSNIYTYIVTYIHTQLRGTRRKRCMAEAVGYWCALLDLARRQREQGNLMKDWTDMLEGRLHAVEAKLGPLENRSTDEDGIAVRAAASAIEAIRAEVAMQVRSAVQTATDGMRRESQKTSEHLKQSLATNRADQEALAATLREECNRVQGEARRA